MFEGRFGLFALHRQDETAQKDFARIDGELGTVWESRRGSFKPFPAAHVIHPYLDAILRLRREHGINPAAVARIVLPIAPYISADRASRRPRSAGRAPISIAASACSARSTRRCTRGGSARTPTDRPRSGASKSSVSPTWSKSSRIDALAASKGLAHADAVTRYLADRQPSGRFINPENVAALVAFLCSPAGADITGAALPVDGGRTAT